MKVNGTGSGSPRIDKLDKLAAYYERRAAALRETIAILAEHTHGPATVRAVLAEAITLRQTPRITPDAAGAEAVIVKRRPGRPRNPAKLSHTDRRAATAAFLDLFDRETPRSGDGIGASASGIGPLIRHGYLRKKRGGYIRTAKPYVIDNRAPAPDAESPA